MAQRSSWIFSSLAVIVWLWLLAPAAYSQAEVANGSIEIIVNDSSGAAMAGVALEVKNRDTGFTRQLQSTEFGLATALLLPVGTYEITAQKAGFNAVKVTDVLVQVGERRTVTVAMRVMSVNEQITVSGGDVPLVETSRINSSARLDDQAVHNLPTLARNFQSFILLTPGTMLVNRTGTEANFSVAGQKGIHSDFTVDGAEYANEFFGGQIGGDRPPFTISLEAIQEFVVLSNGFNAEFGRSGGGVMNAVTKSGTNQYHGTAFWFFQDHTFVTDDAFGRPPLGRRQQFGGSVGGPIKKDRLFFFAVTDNQRRSTPINIAFNNQSTLQDAVNSSDPNRQAAAQAFLSQQKQISAGDNVWSLFGKVDWVINSKNNLSTHYNVSRNNAPNGTYGLLPQQARSVDNFGLEHNSVDALNVQLASILTPKALNEFRLNVTREDRPRLDYSVSGTTPKNGTSGAAQVTVTGIGNLGHPSFLPIGSLEWRRQVTDNFSYEFGKHDLKFGTDLNFVSFYNLFRGNAPGLFTFFTFDNFVAKQPDQYFQFFGSGETTTYPKLYAGFTQDTYKIKPGLTLNYGLRWDGQINPTGDLPNTDFLAGTKKIPNDLKQWSPRFGLAWDPKNNGKNVVRLFGAYLYAPVPTLIWANVLRQNGDVSNGLQYVANRGTNPQDIPPFTFPYQGPYQTPFGSYPLPITQKTGTVSGSNVNEVDPHFHNPRVLRTNASYERALMRDLTITVTYDYTDTTGNERWRDLNIFPGTVQPQTGRIIYDRSTRPYLFAGQVIQREATAVAHYQALTLSANKRFSHRFQVQGFYTYGRNFTNDDNENNCCSAEGYDQFNWKLDWSRSRLDIRHNFVFNSVVDLPYGLQVSPIVKAQSGRPFEATTGTDSPGAYVLSAAALANFQNYIGLPNAVVYGGGNGDSNFTDRPIVNGKLLPRNFFTQPAYFRTDLRVSKIIRFGERRELRGIVDFFNLFNNANKFTTNTVMSNTSFGTLNNADDPFAIQIAGKFIW